MATILIVDDSSTDRALLGSVVRAAGHAPVFANDGEEAVSSASVHQPALIFMDVVMPGRDGFATCRALKKTPETQNIPIVLVTSKSGESDRFWGRKQGADDHIDKPYTAGVVNSAIRRFIIG
jgi:CheY-like chemotaxis protein